VVSTGAEPLTERKHAPALALSRPGEQGVALRAERLAPWRSDNRQGLRELVERVAQAEAATRPRKQGPPPLRGAIKAIGEAPPAPIGRRMLVCRAVQRPLGRGKGRRACLLSGPPMPEHAATDNGGQRHLVGETAAVLCLGDAIGRQRQAAPGEDRHDTVRTQGADQAREGHGGAMPENRTQLQTEPPLGGQQGVAGHRRWPLALAPDAMREDREHGLTCRTLYTPDRYPTQADTDIMRVARQAPSPATGCLVCELKAEGEEKSAHELEKRLALAKQVRVGRFGLKIDGDGAIFSCRFGGCVHGSPLCHQVSAADETRWG
jgi:hypothetical protein